MNRRMILLIAAVVIAALGATLVFLYVQGINDRAVADQNPTPVLEAKLNISAGESIDAAQQAGKLKLVNVPKASILPGALTSVTALKGQAALTTIYAGEQILPQKFGKAATAAAAAATQTIAIPDGKLAISVQLGDPQRVAGFLTPGSKVAIFDTAQLTGTAAAGATGGTGFTRLLLPNVEVIGVGSTTLLSTTKTDASGAQTTEQLPATILTLALSQKDAEKVIFATTNGALTFGLTNNKSVVRPSQGINAQNLFK